MKPPTNAAMMHSSMARPSTRICAAGLTGSVSSDLATSSVCPADSRMMGYLRCRMESRMISPIRTSSPSSMAWSISSVSTYSSTRPAPPAIQAASSAEARTITPTAAPYTAPLRTLRSWMQGRTAAARAGHTISRIGIAPIIHAPFRRKTVYFVTFVIILPFFPVDKSAGRFVYFFTIRVPVLWHFPLRGAIMKEICGAAAPGKEGTSHA